MPDQGRAGNDVTGETSMGTMTEITTPAEAAAEWWTAKLASRPLHDNGDRSGVGLFTTVVAGMLAERQPLDDERLERFRQLLTEKLDELAADQLRYRDDVWLSLGTDYGPDMVLGDVADAAGVSTSLFPWKTHMVVRSDHVTAADGYQRPHLLVWAAPTYDRPPCGDQRWSIEGDTFTHHPGKCGLPKFHEGEHGDWQPSPLCIHCGEPEEWPNHDASYGEPRCRFEPSEARL